MKKHIIYLLLTAVMLAIGILPAVAQDALAPQIAVNEAPRDRAIGVDLLALYKNRIGSLTYWKGTDRGYRRYVVDGSFFRNVVPEDTALYFSELRDMTSEYRISGRVDFLRSLDRDKWELYYGPGVGLGTFLEFDNYSGVEPLEGYSGEYNDRYNCVQITGSLSFLAGFKVNLSQHFSLAAEFRPVQANLTYTNSWSTSELDVTTSDGTSITSESESSSNSYDFNVYALRGLSILANIHF